ncbi:uncharacterized protein UV8b_07585 [Ustilaginoidea virens]|uniref:Uncharacterized protein n=1 Tax=Ustilaginoidea virens TaxID=1159556 RepID=A0A8E5HXB5_USTVR|nr:uncharacterized protein UV8b_07585 [Ustilaginoidea virens]QUC23344.1 hypothetical protein UV8b_07585 [Ustilaginoidea virens]
MDAGGLAQMSSNSFTPAHGLSMPTSGLASRRGGQTIKPLSFDAAKQNNVSRDGSAPTPRTSRSHLLAGLRTAPKSAAAATFGPGPLSPTVNATPQQYAQHGMVANLYGYGQDNAYSAAPKTAFPQFSPPPELAMDDQAQEHMDPSLYAQLVATNMYLAQQQQRLQQQLRSVQAAAQQFQQLNMSNSQLTQQQMALYEQQQQLRNMQQQVGMQAAMNQGQQIYYSPVTGQYYVDTSSANAAQVNSHYAEQPLSPTYINGFQQQQQQQQQQQVFQQKQKQKQQKQKQQQQQQQQQQEAQQKNQQAQQGTPRVQVSPPPESSQTSFQTSPPKRHESPSEVTPLPPPSANAFRRGHKKASSLAPVNAALAAASAVGEAPKSSAAKTAASFPLTPLTGGYGPGQARAGEHPVRQPRGPPSLDELKSKPTARHEGSKNFAARTRRSAVYNLVRAGLERRKGTCSSTGSMSPVSETAEESGSPVTDNDSDSGRSGSGSLVGEEECSSSRTSASGSWGAIGSDRPSSRQKARCSVDSTGCTSAGEVESSSFANAFKNGAIRTAKAQELADSQRKAPRLVLTSIEKRRAAPIV